MNPEYVAANFVHTIPEKLTEYLLEPFTDIFVILVLIIMFANMYMLKKLWKIKARDYITILNVLTLCVYISVSIISAVLVSRLGPHGVLAKDECDKFYMILPRALFLITAIINVIECIMNIFTKIKKDKEYKETVERGYFAEETTNENNEKKETENKSQSANKLNIVDNITSFAEELKDRIDIDGIKSKVNQGIEDLKELINKRNDKE